jgi:hypothetical protein
MSGEGRIFRLFHDLLASKLNQHGDLFKRGLGLRLRVGLGGEKGSGALRGLGIWRGSAYAEGMHWLQNS